MSKLTSSKKSQQISMRRPNFQLSRDRQRTVRRIETYDLDQLIKLNFAPELQPHIQISLLQVATITPQQPVDALHRIWIEAYRPTVYRALGNFVLFGAGPAPMPESNPERYRAIELAFAGEIPASGYFIDFTLDVNSVPTYFLVGGTDKSVTLSGTTGNVVVSTSIPGPKQAGSGVMSIYLEQVLQGQTMEYWSFLKAVIYQLVFLPKI